MSGWLARNGSALRLRVLRQYLLARAVRRGRRLVAKVDRSHAILRGDLLAFVTLRNERLRLPYFLEYYRSIGIDHFVMVDNASDDGSAQYLCAQPDVSLWQTDDGYKAARFGMDWLTFLQRRLGHGHWCLTVDPDEFLIYPHCDTRPLRALTDWLESSAIRSFSAMLIDIYPKGPLDAQPAYREGQNPMDLACWFDPANYTIRRNGRLGNLWIQGGPRARMFFADQPMRAPALNKIPLVHWHRSYAWLSSTHMLLPRALNLVYDVEGGEKASGCLLHAKFLSTFADKSAEELDRRQHYSDSHEYKAYHAGLMHDVDLWTPQSRALEDWRQLEDIGLISRGNWA